jgi:hypothetical protein
MVQGSAAEVTRDEKLTRYRHLREINARQQTGAVRHIARDTILDCGRRLGVVHGGTLVCNSTSEMVLVFDLCVYTGKAGRSRGIDRYARSVGPTLAGDEAMMLRAAQAAHFRIWRIERTHEIAGLSVADIYSGNKTWLIDEGMEATGRAGLVFAGRLMVVDDFVMTCGVSVPLSVELLAAALGSMPKIAPARFDDMLDDPRFALLIYRSAVETGVIENMQFVGSDELALEVEAAD